MAKGLRAPGRGGARNDAGEESRGYANALAKALEHIYGQVLPPEPEGDSTAGAPLADDPSLSDA